MPPQLTNVYLFEPLEEKRKRLIYEGFLTALRFAENQTNKTKQDAIQAQERYDAFCARYGQPNRLYSEDELKLAWETRLIKCVTFYWEEGK